MCSKNCQFSKFWNTKLDIEHRKLSKLMDMWDNFDDHRRTYPLKDPSHIRQVTDNLRNNRVRRKEIIMTSINDILNKKCPLCNMCPYPRN